jgi:hypothetical protein
MPKIFITGCSWGCGEWKFIGEYLMSDEILHRGLEQYFNDSGYQVVNVSQSGSGNRLSVDRLETALADQFVTGDIILFIQSDPIRDFRPDNSYTLPPVTKVLTDRLFIAGSLQKLHEELFNEQYKRLDVLASKYNTIHLIGGLFNIHDTAGQYKNLNLLVKSWVHLLIGHMPEYAHTSSSNFGISNCTWNVNSIKLHEYDLPLAGNLIEEISDFFKNYDVLREDIFHPDGLHPNRQGHKILFDYIIKELHL